MDDLRFSQQEMLQLLPRLLAQPLTTEQYVTLATRANGWITALHLLVASIHEGGTIEEVCALPQRHLNDYMVEEVLLQQPEEIQRFLLATAPLDSFDISLASAVSLQANSEAMLDYLSRHNIFIEAQDSQRGWFRYQPLFAEVLRGYLRQHSASLLPELYLRACTWYQQNGLLNNALYYATQATGNAMIALPQADNQLGNLTNYYPTVQTIPTLKHARRKLFTQRENEVIDLLWQGASNREIAAKLIISEGTVKKHVANICGKLEVKSRTQALAKLMPQLTPALNSRDVPASRAG
jgi:LuxR family maltose regulon positive regulatory protein